MARTTEPWQLLAQRFLRTGPARSSPEPASAETARLPGMGHQKHCEIGDDLCKVQVGRSEVSDVDGPLLALLRVARESRGQRVGWCDRDRRAAPVKGGVDSASKPVAVEGMGARQHPHIVEVLYRVLASPRATIA